MIDRGVVRYCGPCSTTDPIWIRYLSHRKTISFRYNDRTISGTASKTVFTDFTGFIYRKSACRQKQMRISSELTNIEKTYGRGNRYIKHYIKILRPPVRVMPGSG